MADEPETIADTAIELETPAIDTVVETNDLPEVVEEDTGAEVDEELFDENGNPVEAEQPETVAEDDDEEVEFNGKTFKAPKGLKESLLMQEDYTRKTQAIAAKSRDLDLAMRITEAEVNARAQIVQIDTTLKQYEKVDWKAWEQQDFVAANTAWREYQQLKDTRSTASNQLSEAQGVRAQAAQQDLAKRAEETAKFAAKNIKGWTPKMGDELYAFATKTAGLSQEAIRNSLSPEFLQFLHWANTGYQLQQRASAPKPKPATPAPRPQPLRTVAAKSSPPARVSLKDADMDAYVAARKRGVGG